MRWVLLWERESKGSWPRNSPRNDGIAVSRALTGSEGEQAGGLTLANSLESPALAELDIVPYLYPCTGTTSFYGRFSSRVAGRFPGEMGDCDPSPPSAERLSSGWAASQLDKVIVRITRFEEGECHMRRDRGGGRPCRFSS
jgi:hypothetical protein